MDIHTGKEILPTIRIDLRSDYLRHAGKQEDIQSTSLTRKHNPLRTTSGEICHRSLCRG